MIHKQTRRQFLGMGVGVTIGSVVPWELSADQEQAFDWTRSYGGGHEERFNSIARTANDRYVVAGYIRRASDTGEGWAAQLDSAGELQWVRGYLSPPHLADEYGSAHDEIEKRDAFETVIPTGTGGAVLAGWFWPDDVDMGSPWLVRVNEQGWIENQQSLTGLGHNDTYFNDGVGVNDGFAFCGATGAGLFADFFFSDGLIARLSGDGTPEWAYAYNPSDGRTSPDSEGVGAEFTSIHQTSGGGFVLAGEAAQSGGDSQPTRGWVLAVNATGQVQWQALVDRESNTRLQDVIQTPDGGYLAVGRTGTEDTGKEMYTTSSFSPDTSASGIAVKLSSSGEREWQRVYEGTPIHATASAGSEYIFAGMNSGTAAVLRADSQGQIQRTVTVSDSDAPSTFTTVDHSGERTLLAGYESSNDFRPCGIVARVGSTATETSVIAISGRESGGNTAYVFTYDGTISKSRGGIRASINDADVVSDGLVEGEVSTGADAYELTGTITSIVLHGPATLLVGGTEVSPSQIAPPPAEPNVLFISGRETGGPGSYEFDVSGTVVKSRYRLASINNDTETRDTIENGHVEGQVESGADAFRFSGNITNFALNGNLTVSLNGADVDPADF